MAARMWVCLLRRWRNNSPSNLYTFMAGWLAGSSLPMLFALPHKWEHLIKKKYAVRLACADKIAGIKPARQHKGKYSVSQCTQHTNHSAFTCRPVCAPITSVRACCIFFLLEIPISLRWVRTHFDQHFVKLLPHGYDLCVQRQCNQHARPLGKSFEYSRWL